MLHNKQSMFNRIQYIIMSNFWAAALYVTE